MRGGEGYRCTWRRPSSVTPLSVLPDISPSTSQEDGRRPKLLISPLEGEMPGRAERGASRGPFCHH
ncbi:hypothetical protein FJ567_28230 [Mesorhizobium sp. B2-4-16]|nr:hypothetical protein FJ567_28230 [Mesorhizobium sp. B2-4-16]TPL59177.1 hypothetical protein FJ956_28995 [Mesorhizobium sp. B2-4-3]